MKVLLINPPFFPSAELISKQYPLNLAYIGTYLEEKGFNIKLIDLNIECMNMQKFKDLLLQINPAVIGITSMTSTFHSVMRIAAIINEVLPATKIVVGGTHVTALPEETLQMCSAIDFIVTGEGEETFLEICERVKNNQTLEEIKGTVYRSDGTIRREEARGFIEELDTLPFPRRDYIDMDKYKRSHVNRGLSRKYLNIMEMVLSRGCPGRCIFCAANVIWRNKIRFRSVKNIIEEIEYCKERFNTGHFSFEDDSFTFNRNWAESLCAALKKQRISWNCNVRVDMVSPDLLRLMADSGCIKVQFGIESGSQRILDLIQKNISIEQVKRAVEWANQAKIRFIEGSFILGIHPEENLEEIYATLRLIKHLKINLLMVSLACPFPGTKLYELIKRYLPHNEIKWEEYIFFRKRTTFSTRYLSGNQLVRLQRKAYLDFYLRPKLIWKMWDSSRSFTEKCYWLASGIVFLKSFLPFDFNRIKRDEIF